MFQIYKNFNNLMSLYGKQKLNNSNFYARINYSGGSVLINQIMNPFDWQFSFVSENEIFL